MSAEEGLPYLYETTLPTNGLPSQSQLARQLQADLVKYAKKQAHAKSDERRNTVGRKPSQGEILVAEGVDLYSHQQDSPAIMVNGTGPRSSLSSTSSEDSDQSSHSLSLLREPNTSSERVFGECVVVQQSNGPQQQGPGESNPPNQHDQPGVVVTTEEDQEKVCKDHTSSTSQKDESAASSLDSSLTNETASPPTALSHLKSPTNRAPSPSWAGQPAISVTMGTPAVSLSTFITQTEDLPSPSAITPNRIFKVCVRVVSMDAYTCILETQSLC